MVIDRVKSRGLPLVSCPHTRGLQLDNVINNIVDNHRVVCTQTRPQSTQGQPTQGQPTHGQQTHGQQSHGQQTHRQQSHGQQAQGHYKEKAMGK